VNWRKCQMRRSSSSDIASTGMDVGAVMEVRVEGKESRHRKTTASGLPDWGGQSGRLSDTPRHFTMGTTTNTVQAIAERIFTATEFKEIAADPI
jgi:hypothetical protein